MGPEYEWDGGPAMRDQIAEWTKKRGKQDDCTPARGVVPAQAGPRSARESGTAAGLAARAKGRARGHLGRGIREGRSARDRSKGKGDAKTMPRTKCGPATASPSWPTAATARAALKVIDLGAGHSSAAETLCGRIIAALKAEALLNETVGVGYIDRNWPPAFKTTGAWPLASLRQSFLNGALTRLLDPDNVLPRKDRRVRGPRRFRPGFGSETGRDLRTRLARTTHSPPTR